MKSYFPKTRHVSDLRIIIVVLISLCLSNLSYAEKTAFYPAVPENGFLTKWLMLGPIPILPTTDTLPIHGTSMKVFFENDQLGGESTVAAAKGASVRIGNASYQWRYVEFPHNLLDLTKVFAKKDTMVAYGYTEIEAGVASKQFMTVGSDDAIRIWLNGKLIHDTWIFRGLAQDDDQITLDLKPGRNRLLVKVLNAWGGWGFVCRFPSKSDLGTILSTEAAHGHLDQVKQLLEAGAPVNPLDSTLVSAWQSARLNGRKATSEYLAAHGADTNRAFPSLERMIDQQMNALIKGDNAGAAILIASEGKILYEHGYGLANIRKKISILPQTTFRIGSITKQFTAAAILRLQEEGRLSIHDTLSKFFPDFPRAKEVTLYQLLTHTSGIHSYTDKPDFMQRVRSPITPSQLMEYFKNDPYVFNPGERFQYCNSGYFLLGQIIEKVSGKSYGDFLQQTFFQPLGMKSTGVYQKGIKLDHEALGYSYENGKSRLSINWDMSWATSAGALYSSVGDLFFWNEGLFNGKVLKEESLKAAFTPAPNRQANDTLPEQGYGLGWVVSNLRNEVEIQHVGGLNGFVTQLMRLPRQNLTVVVLTNSMPPLPGMDVAGVSRAIAQMYAGRNMAWVVEYQEIPPLAEKIVESYVGRYDLYGQNVSITREGDRLFGQMGVQSRVELFPLSDTSFFLKVMDATIVFNHSDKGTVTGITMNQSGMQLSARRIEDALPVTVPTAILDGYVGKYTYKAINTEMTISREGTQLYTQLSGQPRFEIYPKAESVFFLKVAAAQLTFVKDDKGRTVKALLEQGGNIIEGLRVR
jgi:CubicO group peptidase (beta-lactamase class C family)